MDRRLDGGPGPALPLSDRIAMHRILHAPVVLLLAVATLVAQPSATLELQDISLGTTTAGSTLGELIPSHVVTLRIAGTPGDRHALLLSGTPAPAGLSVGGVAVGVDPAALVPLWDGLADPAVPPLGAAGTFDLTFLVPDTFALGTVLYLQAVVVAPGGGALGITNHLELTFSGETVAPLDSGLFSGHPAAQVSGGAMLTIADQLSYNAFWAQHTIATVPPPFVDFTTSFALVHFRGTFTEMQPTVSIDTAYRDGFGVLQVFTTLVIPGVPPPPITCQPWTMAALPLVAFSTSTVEHQTVISLP